jgi:hypothetical protein
MRAPRRPRGAECTRRVALCAVPASARCTTAALSRRRARAALRPRPSRWPSMHTAQCQWVKARSSPAGCPPVLRHRLHACLRVCLHGSTRRTGAKPRAAKRSMRHRGRALTRADRACAMIDMGWIDGWVGGWVGGWVDRWVSGCTRKDQQHSVVVQRIARQVQPPERSVCARQDLCEYSRPCKSREHLRSAWAGLARAA